MQTHLKPITIALGLILSLPLVSADLSYYCEMAKDGSAFVQNAYCCDDLVPARYAPDFFQAENCTPADPKTVGDKCPNDGMMPVCCYTIEHEFICTSNGYIQDL